MPKPARETPSKRTYRVFVSSTYMDNVDRRRKVLDAVRRTRGFEPVAMEWWPADERPPEVVDEHKLADADVFLLIVAHRYGELCPGKGRSYTELEFDRARELGIPILAFQIDPSSPVKGAPPQAAWNVSIDIAGELQPTRGFAPANDGLVRVIAPAGDATITVRCGDEFEPWVQTMTLSAGAEIDLYPQLRSKAGE